MFFGWTLKVKYTTHLLMFKSGCLGAGGLGDNSVYGVSVCSKTIYFAAFAARLKTYMFPMYPSSQTDDPVGMIPNENVKSCI